MLVRSFAAVTIALAVAIWAATFALHAAPQQSRTWTLEEDADTKKNPLDPDEQTLNAGKALFKAKCSRCHGAAGKGDGPDSDPDATEMDLTNPKRAARHPDGVVYYKVLHGKGRPKMPAFKDEMTEQEIWTVVTFVQTLRQKP